MAREGVLEPGRWLTSEDLDRVDDNAIREAAHSLAALGEQDPFGDSTDYDVVLQDGVRLPPKAVFGLAARKVLGMDVRPRNFRGGAGTPCFRAIEAAGFEIEPKRDGDQIPSDPGEEWAEGEPRRVSHLRYERNREAVRHKKEAYREEHGHLACEECGLVPVDVERYGTGGEACIEVHHKVPLARLGKRRKTKVEDLMCVCANCHRVLHYQMRVGER